MKNRFWNFLVDTFEFSDEEQRAIDHQQPMTQELFNLCLDKCMVFGTERLFYQLLDEYPEFMIEYAKQIEKEIKDVEFPESTLEEEESWTLLCERIREEYRSDII